MQEKLDERARKREVCCLKKSSSVADKTSATKDNLHSTSDTDIVSNPGDSENLEQDSDQEVYQKTKEEFKPELNNPKIIVLIANSTMYIMKFLYVQKYRTSCVL